MKAILPILTVVFALGMSHSVKAGCTAIGGPIAPYLVVAENQPVARIWLYRDGDTNLIQTVDYFTVEPVLDGDPEVWPTGVAKPGVDYLPRSGTAVFPVGQTATYVDVPLVDNGALDTFRDFTLMLNNPSPGLTPSGGFWPWDIWPVWVRVEDNELGAAVDPLFVQDAATIPPISLSSVLELSNGTSLESHLGMDGFGAATWLTTEGMVESNLARFRGPPNPCRPYVSLAPAGDGSIFAVGTITSVDGFPRNGFARLFTHPSERDFRVITPADFTRSSGIARLQVARTGATTNAASVSYATRDDTAKAGEDYVLQCGTLQFAPLEVSKVVEVPLLAGSELVSSRHFMLELKNPSTGYTTIAATPIAVFPELRLVTESIRWWEGTPVFSLLLHGVAPGSSYSLESSTDLNHWATEVLNAPATESTLRFGELAPLWWGNWWNLRQVFFRALKR